MRGSSMTRQTLYFSLAFQKGRGSSLKAGQPRLAKTEVEATRSAERLGLSSLGAIAYSVTGDAETGDFDSPRVLLTLGSVPEDFGAS